MIIADENIPLPIIKALQLNGIETLSIFEEFRGISDVEIVKLAKTLLKL